MSWKRDIKDKMNKFLLIFLVSVVLIDIVFCGDTEAGNLKQAFRQMDANDDKKVTFEEVSNYLKKSIGNSADFNLEDTVRSFIQQFDKNGDDELTMNEFASHDEL